MLGPQAKELVSDALASGSPLQWSAPVHLALLTKLLLPAVATAAAKPPPPLNSTGQSESGAGTGCVDIVL